MSLEKTDESLPEAKIKALKDRMQAGNALLEKVSRIPSMKQRMRESVDVDSVDWTKKICDYSEFHILLNTIKANSLRTMSLIEEISPQERNMIWEKLFRLIDFLVYTNIGSKLLRQLPSETSIAYCNDMEKTLGLALGMESLILLSGEVLDDFKVSQKIKYCAYGAVYNNSILLHEVAHLIHRKIFLREMKKGISFYDACCYDMMNEFGAVLAEIELLKEKTKLGKAGLQILIECWLKYILYGKEEYYFRIFEGDEEFYKPLSKEMVHLNGFFAIRRHLVALYPDLGKMKISRQLKRGMRQMYLKFLKLNPTETNKTTVQK